MTHLAITRPQLSNLITAAVLTDKNKKAPLAPGMDAVDAAIAMKTDLLEKIEKLGDKLPPNTIDELIDSFGGPEAVAEVGTRESAAHQTKIQQN